MTETKLFKYDEDGVREVGVILRNGGIAGIPTETVYGLAANAFDGQAVAKIFKAKGRPQDNPLIVHICDISQLDGIVSSVPEGAIALAEKFWPGPLSIIMPKGGNIPDEVSCGLDTVAVRMPSHPAARDIIKAAGVPLAAPSANLSGSPSPTTAKHVIDDMWGRADAILDGGSCAVGVESTVISLVGEKPRLLRPGGISLEQLESVLGEVEVDSAVLSELQENEKAASPGMKYKHYSPKCEVFLVESTEKAFFEYAKLNAGQNDYLMIFDGDINTTGIKSITYGANDKENAEQIFACLRKADELNAKRAFVRAPSKSGVGLAVYNRLIRAAGFKVITLN